MDTVPEYVAQLLLRQISSTPQIGIQVLLSDRAAWLTNIEQLILTGTIMKVLTDKGVVTDEEWQTALDGALDGEWPEWVLTQTDPNPLIDPGAEV